MFCDKPICKEGCQHGHCSQPGECICHPGWFGPNCDQCVKLPGCTHNGYCTKPMECKCQPGWTGHFCHKPICRPGCNETTGFCSKPGECWCRVGWTGPKWRLACLTLAARMDSANNLGNVNVLEIM